MLFSNHPEGNTLFNFWGEFLSKESERRFQVYRWRSDARRFQFVFGLSALIYLSGITIDYLDNMSFSEAFLIMASLRIAVFVAGIALCLLISMKGTYLDLTNLTTGYMIMIGVSEAVSNVLDSRIGISEMGMPFIVAIVIFYYLCLPPRLLSAFIGGSVSSTIYLLTLINNQVAGAAHIFTVFDFLLFANIFGFFFFVSFNRAQRNEYRAFEEERSINRQLQVEIAERIMAEKRLVAFATIDELTHIANRRYFIELATREIELSKRNGSVFCMLMIDVDHFKRINDNYGHDIGDMALRRIVEVCRANLRAIDVIGRLGGEEFAVLLPGTDLDKGLVAAERIRQAVAVDTIPLGSEKLGFTISVGVAGCSGADNNVDVVLKKADIALYKAKRKGRNTVCTIADEDTGSAEEGTRDFPSC